MYTRETPFSYACAACSRCCHAKRIHVNPYEVARLARSLGTSTTEVRTRHTEAGGTTLAVRENDACVFLSERGCSVHPDRPLVCRLYPLGRLVDDQGREGFFELSPHPASEGRYGSQGTVGSFLAAQEVEPYLAAAAGYRAVLAGWIAALAPEPGGRAAVGELLGSPAAASATGELLDLDRAVAAECTRRGTPEPSEMQARLELHLEILRKFAGPEFEPAVDGVLPSHTK